MRDRPYRTGTTWLTDDQLVLLDVLFDVSASLHLLRRENFLEQWNLGYDHGLDDAALECNIRWLCEHGALEPQRDGDHTWFQMTGGGGELWSKERCPVWERYCTERYTTTSRGRTQMSVMAVSPEVRDHFLALWPEYPARRKTTVISDCPLIAWHPFPRVYVGVATYEERHQWTPAEYVVWAEQHHLHWAMLERERSWWRCVPELQRFAPRPAEPSGAPDPAGM
jgi:hypothetical protein